MGEKVCLRCKGKTLLGIVNKLLKTKSFLKSPSKVDLGAAAADSAAIFGGTSASSSAAATAAVAAGVALAASFSTGKFYGQYELE